ncbi:LCP family protein [Candidatus Saccharibacteria bacterium]|nr:LCP family protein [Candidatus Saccharibacteria bacterium]
MSRLKRRILWYIGAALVAVQAVTSVLLAVSIIRMEILEMWVVILIIVSLILLLMICMAPIIFRKKHFGVFRYICIIVSIICIAGSIFAFRYTNAMNGFLDKVSLGDEVENAGKDVTKEPFIMYVSGTDSRNNVEDPDARSDVNILLVVNPVTGKILSVSIPRDTYVQIHGTTGLKDKLTHAGLNNDVERSKATIEDFLGNKFEIDYTVKVSFDTVVEVVDQLDGIDINSDKAMHLAAESKKNPSKYCDYVVGKQHVDGDCALRFARERKSYARGDKHRGENQQEVLAAIINRFLSSKKYLMKLPEILDIAADSFETTFSRDDITEFMRFQLANNIDWQIESIGLDGVGDMLPTHTYGEKEPLWVMIPDEKSYEQIIKKMEDNLKVEKNS